MEGQIDFTELTEQDLIDHITHFTKENFFETTQSPYQFEIRFQKTFGGFKKTKICDVCQKQKLNKTCLD